MFIPTMLNEAPGLHAERCVWDAVTQVFDEQSTIAIHHYPMFFSNSSGRREIDILIVNDNLGVCVIEVKGVNINQISSIQGHQWSYTDFYEEKGNPFEQAENQLNMLCNHLEMNPLLYRRLTKRVFVALPYVSEQQWQERGIHRQINAPLPIFKEDLSNPSKLLSKLKGFALSKTDSPLTKLEMKKVSHVLGIQASDQNNSLICSQLHFSHLYIVNTQKDFETSKKNILKALKRGTKIYILSYTHLLLTDFEEYNKYVSKFQLNIYNAEKVDFKNALPAASFVDGEHIADSTLIRIKEHFPSFNLGQFKAIHQPVSSQQIITAGAGTGKTHVMIDRILFLLMNSGISLNHITMITFTNASTKEMKKRLEERFLLLFKLTGNGQFLLFAEEVKDMQISTIHSFARSIINQLAHEIGYGRKVNLRSFDYEKKVIIQKLIDEFFSTRPVELFLDTKLKDYEFINLVSDMWDEMEKKGLTAEEINRIDWGTVLNTNTRVIQETFKYIFSNCENRLDELKRAENAITMGDLIRKLKLFTGDEEKMKQLSSDHFIFVDEFQDSDSVQINLLVSLQRFLKYRLFVVGDVKQAIYRFRGADYKSFMELKDANNEIEYEEIELQINYRTSASLLNKMHSLFERWDKKGWLAYNKSDRLISNKKSYFPNKDWHVSLNYEDYLDKALKTLPNKKDRIALIVRTNHQAKQIKQYCISKTIPTTENLDGTFFSSQPIIDFKALLNGLLYSDEPKFLINALETPYFGCDIPYHVLIPLGGKKERITSFLNERTNNSLKHYVHLLRTLAPMTVVQKIISDNQLFARLPDYMEKHLQKENVKAPSKEEIQISILRYEKNLQHLMLLIEKHFSSKHITLQTLCDWLNLQINTNRIENEPVLEQHDVQVEITTVHRSKGLEYHTVFLPITNSPFNAVEQQYYLEEAAEKVNKEAMRRFGWRIVNKDSDPNYENSHYLDLKAYEDVEQLKEETRLLYVALTRAEQRVYITMPKPEKINNSSWAFLLEGGGLIEGLEKFK